MKIINLFTPGRYGSDFVSVISKHMLQIKFKSISCEIDLRWLNIDSDNGLVPKPLSEPILTQSMLP